MPSQRIRRITEQLPYSLRAGVEGYVDSVAAVIPDIARDARVEITGERIETFLLVVAIRRIWSTIDSQYWIMNDCIEVATQARDDTERMPTRGFRIGSEEISRGSVPMRECQRLRQDFQELIARLEITDLVFGSDGLADVAMMMFPRDRA